MDTIFHVSCLASRSLDKNTDSGCATFRIGELERPSVEAEANIDLSPLFRSS
jgi:hypothetical protein